MHVRAVEQRVALGEQRHIAPRVKVRGDPPGGIEVEVLHRTGVSAGMIGHLGGPRIKQVLLDLTGPQIRFGDTACDAAPVAGAVIGHLSCFTDRSGGLDGHPLRVAGSQPHPPERAPGRHSLLLAIALTAAAAMALPPRRPCTTRYDKPRGRSMSSCLDCADPTNPTGPPSTATGGETPSSISSSSRKRAVGALPIASTAPANRSAQSSTPAAERVVCRRSARSTARGSATSDTTWLSAGNRVVVTPAATIDESHRTGAPRCKAALVRDTTSSLN